MLRFYKNNHLIYRNNQWILFDSKTKTKLSFSKPIEKPLSAKQQVDSKFQQVEIS